LYTIFICVCNWFTKVVYFLKIQVKNSEKVKVRFNFIRSQSCSVSFRSHIGLKPGSFLNFLSVGWSQRQLGHRIRIIHFWSQRQLGYRIRIILFWSQRQLGYRIRIIHFWSQWQLGHRIRIIHFWSQRQLGHRIRIIHFWSRWQLWHIIMICF